MMTHIHTFDIRMTLKAYIVITDSIFFAPLTGFSTIPKASFSHKTFYVTLIVAIEILKMTAKFTVENWTMPCVLSRGQDVNL